MKGIVLAGGTGTRLWPITKGTSKQLLHVFDKPMVYYPLSTLMLAGVREILIITTPHEQVSFKELLGDGSQFGISLQYEIQEKPEGLAQALIIAEDFLAGDSCLLILGDNIFYGVGVGQNLAKSISNMGSHIFTYRVKDPQNYGVLYTVDEVPVKIVEKPNDGESNLAVTGLYFFDNRASGYAKSIKPGKRGELEITDLIDVYLQQKELGVTYLSRGVAWLDTGTPSGMNDAANFVKVMEDRTGLKIACLEEIALSQGWIHSDTLLRNLLNNKSEYAEYLRSVVKSGY